jgi:hypothetical protein
MGQGMAHFILTTAKESTMDKDDEKKFKGFPMFFTFENFERAFLSDMRQ